MDITSVSAIIINISAVTFGIIVIYISILPSYPYFKAIRLLNVNFFFILKTYNTTDQLASLNNCFFLKLLSYCY